MEVFEFLGSRGAVGFGDVMGEHLEVVLKVGANAVDAVADVGQIGLPIWAEPQSRPGTRGVTVEAGVVGRLFWPQRFHESVSFDPVAVKSEVGDEFGGFAQRETGFGTVDPQGAENLHCRLR